MSEQQSSRESSREPSSDPAMGGERTRLQIAYEIGRVLNGTSFIPSGSVNAP
jgi:hypothetical protein